MNSLKKIHKEYFDRKFKSSKFSLPITVSEKEVPVIATSKWRIEDSFLVKDFLFETNSTRNEFIKEILDYESKISHNANISIFENSVEIKLITKNLNQITSIDKEYAKYCDVLFKELAYNTIKHV